MSKLPELPFHPIRDTTERFNVRLRAVLFTNTAPVHISAPDRKDGMPIQHVGGVPHVYIPATTLRGWDRHAVNREAIGDLHKFRTVDEALMNTVGGAKGSVKGTVPVPQTERLTRLNPILDALGCGSPTFIGGRMTYFDAVSVTPLAESLKRSGVRRNPIDRGDASAANAEAVQAVQKRLRAIQKPLKDANEAMKKARGNKEAEEAILANLLKVIPEDYHPANGEKVDRKWLEKTTKKVTSEFTAAGVSDVSALMPLSTVAIPAKVEMSHEIHAMNVRPCVFGLYLTAVSKKTATNPVIGGRAATGHGGFLHRIYEVLVQQPDLSWKVDCSIELKPFEPLRILPDTGSGEFVIRAMKEWNEAKENDVFDYSIPVWLTIENAKPETDEGEDEGADVFTLEFPSGGRSRGRK